MSSPALSARGQANVPSGTLRGGRPREPIDEIPAVDVQRKLLDKVACDAQATVKFPDERLDEADQPGVRRRRVAREAVEANPAASRHRYSCPPAPNPLRASGQLDMGQA